MIHIYSAVHQPATRYAVDIHDPTGKPLIVRHKPRTLITCSLCGIRRWAKYLRAQVYYDMTVYSCRPGRGCALHEKAR